MFKAYGDPMTPQEWAAWAAGVAGDPNTTYPGWQASVSAPRTKGARKPRMSRPRTYRVQRPLWRFGVVRRVKGEKKKRAPKVRAPKAKRGFYAIPPMDGGKEWEGVMYGYGYSVPPGFDPDAHAYAHAAAKAYSVYGYDPNVVYPQAYAAAKMEFDGGYDDGEEYEDEYDYEFDDGYDEAPPEMFYPPEMMMDPYGYGAMYGAPYGYGY